MNCRIVDLRNKEVINIKNGARLGYVSDVEVDTCDARLVAIIIYADRAAAAGASCLKTSFAAFSGYD